MSHPNPPLSHSRAVVILACIFLIGVIVLIIRPTKAANLRAGTAASFVIPKGASSGGGIANVGPLRPANVTIASNAATNAGGGIYNRGIGISKFSDTLIANAGDVGAYAASTFEVNSTADSNDGSCTPVGSGNGCTLREAIERANAESGAELITFAASLTSVGPATITLSNALPDLSSDMNITGPGATLLTIQRSSVVGTPVFRIFTVPGPTVSIAALTLTNGKTPNGSAGGTSGGDGANGGAIHNSGTLTMRDVLVISNRTGNGGNATNSPGNGGKGGGIYNAGTLTMTNCTVSGNNVGNGGSGGTGGGGGGDGGGIYSTGSSLRLTNVIVSDNTAGSSTPSSFGGSGGGIFNHVPTTASMTNCTVSGNSSGNAGGGIQNNGALTVIASTISGNTSTGPGGGLMNQGSATLVNTTISGNSGIFGGGIYDDITPAMILTNCTITNNTASNYHGVITHSGGNARVRNTIIAGNGVGPDVSGVFTSRGNNFIGIPGSGGIQGGGTGFVNGSKGDQVGSTASPLNASLGTLSDNGGPTQTHALLADSTAIDRGNNCVLTNTSCSTLPSVITDDQRGPGFSRNVDGLDADTTKTVDIGAFEAQVSLGDIADQTINEDGSLSLPFNVYGALSITSVTATSSNTALVPNDPANISISGSGSSWTLSINPLANANGTSTITLTVNANDGQTVTTTFLLTVNSVNDVPSFAEGVDQTVNENDSAQSVANWATNISEGPANESLQTVSFVVVSNSNPSLFAVAPAVSPSGTLTYTPQPGMSGAALIGIAAQDNGGTAGGGIDTSATQTFNLIVREGGALQFSSTSYSTAEDGVNAVITVNRTGGAAGEARVNYATSNGTATAGQDYAAASGTLTFADGVTTQTFSVAITNDAMDEAEETINLTLSSAAGSGSLGTPASAVLTINDNDPAPSVLINDVSITEGNSGVVNATFTVSLTGQSGQTVTVDFITANGTANGTGTDGSDFQTSSGTLTFLSLETTKSVTVAINGDFSFEPDETFFVDLSAPTNATISDNQGQGTINNDDAVGGTFAFSSSVFNVSEIAGSILITVNRLGDTTQEVTVNYATADVTADGRKDYTPTRGTLHFDAGIAARAFPVLVNIDAFTEGSELLELTLSDPTGGAALGVPASATLQIDNTIWSPPPANSIDDAQNFVRQHYHDFLNRDAASDPDGLAFWTSQITDCQQPGATCNAEVRRINVSAAFFVSIEFQETGYLVYRVYKAAYGNLSPTAPVPLTFNEFLPDSQQIGQGVVVGVGNWQTQLENNKVAFAQDFVSRMRFVIAYPTSWTPEQFVNALFANAGVTPSAADRDAAINEFGTAGNTADTSARARALRRVAENSTLAQQELNRAFVLMQYFGYLRRNPNDAPEPGLNFDGYNFWLNKLNDFNGNYITAEMVKAFIDSIEYRQRFGP